MHNNQRQKTTIEVNKVIQRFDERQRRRENLVSTLLASTQKPLEVKICLDFRVYLTGE